MDKKLQNMHTPGIKELDCGCVCEVDEKTSIKVIRGCPAMDHLHLLAGEKEPEPGLLFSPGDDILDHIYEGLAKLDLE